MFNSKAMLADMSPIFGQFHWFRRRVGGRWELWWVDHPVCSQIWHYRDPEDDLTQRPTPICRGTPTVEDYRAPVARALK